MQKWRWVTLPGAVVAAVGLLAGCAHHAGADVVASCNADVESVDMAAQAYQGQTGSFPPSLVALTRTLVVDGQPAGPWLKAVPSTRHYTIFLTAPGYDYMYPPGTRRPATLERSHRAFDLGDPCASYAS